MSYLATYGKMVHRFPSTPTRMKHHLCYYISLAHVYKMHTATLNERLQDLQLIDGTLLKIKRQPCPNSPLGFCIYALRRVFTPMHFTTVSLGLVHAFDTISASHSLRVPQAGW